jgi:YVTN family beta-propeller protein
MTTLHLHIKAIMLVAFLTLSTSVIANPFVYIINQGSSDVSVIDTTNNTVIHTEPVCNSPAGIAVTPDNTKVYISCLNSFFVSVIDTTTHMVIDTVSLPVGSRSQEIAITPDGTTAYVVIQDSDTVGIIDINSNTYIGNVSGFFNSPHAIVITPNGQKAYVTNFGIGNSGTTVSVVDLTTDAVSTTITVGQGPAGAAVTPDGIKVYIANRTTGTVSVISTATDTVIGTIVAPAVEVEVTPDGTKAYVTGSNSIINTSTDTIIDTVSVLGSEFAFTPDGTRIYGALYGDNETTVIDATTNTLITTVAVGSTPNGVAVATTVSNGPSTVLAPVEGPFHICMDPNDQPDCPFAQDTWEFWQHMTGFHRTGGGIAGSDETFAWDINLAPEPADKSKEVFAIASGKVVKYGGSVDPGGCSGAVLIEHTKNGKKWWSGYLHMKVDSKIVENFEVDRNTKIGKISNKACPTVGDINNHLHFVVYNGENIQGGLISTDTVFEERPDISPPSVEIKDPNSGTVSAGKEYTIKWKSSDNVVVVSQNIFLSIDGGQTFPTEIVSGLTGNIQTFKWFVPSYLNTKNARIKILAQDGVGNEGQDISDKDFNIK